MTPEQVVRVYGESARLRKTTRETYTSHAAKLIEWAALQDLRFEQATEFDLLHYLDYRRSELGNSESTIRSVVFSLRHFYNWMLEKGLVETSPAADLRPGASVPAERRDTLTVTELRRLWGQAPNLQRQALIGLLGFCGMRPDEVLALDVDDVSKMGDHFGVQPKRRGSARWGSQVLLSPQVHAAVRATIDGRRSGPLFVRQDGNRLDRRTADRWVKRCGVLGEIPFPVTMLTLTYTLRAVAIEQGFTYIGVVRAVGEMHHSRSRRWFASAPTSVDQHAAIRLSRLVFDDPESPLGMLDEAAVCLNETALPPAIAVATAGTALESHLRELCRAKKISMHKPEKDLSIMDYAAVLASEKVVAPPDHRLLTTITAYRNDAAHGWFQRISGDTATWVLREVRRFIVTHPGPSSGASRSDDQLMRAAKTKQDV